MTNQFLEMGRKNDWVVVDTNVLGDMDYRNGLDVELKERLQYKHNLAEAILRHENFITSPEVRDEMEKGVSKIDIYEGFFKYSPIFVFDDRVLGERFRNIYDFLKSKSDEVDMINHKSKYPYADVELGALALSLCYPGERVALLSSDVKLDDLIVSSVVKSKYKTREMPFEFGSLYVYRHKFGKDHFVRHYLNSEMSHPALLI